MSSAFYHQFGSLLLCTIQRRRDDDVRDAATSSVTMTSGRPRTTQTVAATSPASNDAVANAPDESCVRKELLRVFTKQTTVEGMATDGEVVSSTCNKNKTGLHSASNRDQRSTLLRAPGNGESRNTPLPGDTSVDKETDTVFRQALPYSPKARKNTKDADPENNSGQESTLLKASENGRSRGAPLSRDTSLDKDAVSRQALFCPRKVDMDRSFLSGGGKVFSEPSLSMVDRLDNARQQCHSVCADIACLSARCDALLSQLDVITRRLASTDVRETVMSSTDVAKTPSGKGLPVVSDVISSYMKLQRTNSLLELISVSPRISSREERDQSRRMKSLRILERLDDDLCLRLDKLTSLLASSSERADADVTEYQSSEEVSPCECPTPVGCFAELSAPCLPSEEQSMPKSDTPSRPAENQPSVKTSTPDNGIDIYSFVDVNTPAIHALTCLESFTDSGRVKPTLPMADYRSLQSSVMIHTPPSSDASTERDNSEDCYGDFPRLSLSVAESAPSPEDSLSVSVSWTELEASSRAVHQQSSRAEETESTHDGLQLLSLLDQDPDVSSARLRLVPSRTTFLPSEASREKPGVENSVDDSLCLRDSDSEFDWKEYYFESCWDLPNPSLIASDTRSETHYLDGNEDGTSRMANTSENEIQKLLSHGGSWKDKESDSGFYLSSDTHALDSNNNVNTICNTHNNSDLLRTENSAEYGNHDGSRHPDNNGDNNRTVLVDNNNNNNNNNKNNNNTLQQNGNISTSKCPENVLITEDVNDNSNITSDCGNDRTTQLDPVPKCLTRAAGLIVSLPPASTALPEKARQESHRENPPQSTLKMSGTDVNCRSGIRSNMKTRASATSVGHQAKPRDPALLDDSPDQSTPRHQKKRRRRSALHRQHLSLTPCKEPPHTVSLTDPVEGRNGKSRLPVVKTRRPKVQSYDTLEDRSCTLNFLRAGNSPCQRDSSTSDSLLSRRSYSIHSRLEDWGETPAAKEPASRGYSSTRKMASEKAHSANNPQSRSTTDRRKSQPPTSVSGGHHRHCPLHASRARSRDSDSVSRKRKVAMEELKARIHDTSSSQAWADSTTMNTVRSFSTETVAMAPLRAAKRRRQDQPKPVTRSKTSPRKQPVSVTRRQPAKETDSALAERTYQVSKSTDRKALSCIVEEATKEFEAEQSTSLAFNTARSFVHVSGEDGGKDVETEAVVMCSVSVKQLTREANASPKTEDTSPVVTDIHMGAVVNPVMTISATEQQTSVTPPHDLELRLQQTGAQFLQQPSHSAENLTSLGKEAKLTSSEAASKESLANPRPTASEIAEEGKMATEGSVHLSFKNNFDARCTSTPVTGSRHFFVLTSTPLTPGQRPTSSLFLNDVIRKNMFADHSVTLEDSVSGDVAPKDSLAIAQFKAASQARDKDSNSGCKSGKTYVKIGSFAETQTERAETTANDTEIGSEKTTTNPDGKSRRVIHEHLAGCKSDTCLTDRVQTSFLLSCGESHRPLTAETSAVPELSSSHQSIVPSTKRCLLHKTYVVSSREETSRIQASAAVHRDRQKDGAENPDLYSQKRSQEKGVTSIQQETRGIGEAETATGTITDQSPPPPHSKPLLPTPANRRPPPLIRFHWACMGVALSVPHQRGSGNPSHPRFGCAARVRVCMEKPVVNKLAKDWRQLQIQAHTASGRPYNGPASSQSQLELCPNQRVEAAPSGISSIHCGRGLLKAPTTWLALPSTGGER